MSTNGADGASDGGAGGGDEGDARGSRDEESGAGRVVARMPVARDATHYNMGHAQRGLALVFNHEHFDIHSLKARTGTNVDCDNLARELRRLGFRVTVLRDLRADQLLGYVREAAAMDHSAHDCVLLAVLTHGELGMLYARDTHYKPETLWRPFAADQCPSLAGKPKLFLVQACQGDKLDGGVTLAGRTETDGSSLSFYRIPVQADFLVAFSTVPGFFSWRNTTRGSWFVQALCEELRAGGADLDILTLLTFVCRRVALDYESNTPDTPLMHMQKQVPCITSMLTRLLVFGSKK